MPSSRFLFDETRKLRTHNVHRSRPVRVLDFEQCCKVVIGYDVPEHPLAFAVQYATCAEGLTSCMAADAAPHLARTKCPHLLLSTRRHAHTTGVHLHATHEFYHLHSAYEELDQDPTPNTAKGHLESAGALYTCAYMSPLQQAWRRL